MVTMVGVSVPLIASIASMSMSMSVVVELTLASVVVVAGLGRIILDS